MKKNNDAQPATTDEYKFAARAIIESAFTLRSLWERIPKDERFLIQSPDHVLRVLRDLKGDDTLP